MSRTFLFTGPSLHPDLARNLSNAMVLPPIKRGDLERLRSLEPETIGIIDGEFYQNLAVTPKEILPFLERGVRVYGASSMGALRAVELHRCGMIGVGRVFRLFRSGILDADDEVALAYSPSTYEGLSEPLVNTRYALRAAVRRNMLTRAEAAEAIARLKHAYFPDRSRALLLSTVQKIAGKEAVARVRGFLRNGAPNVKEQDARMLIAAIAGSSMGISRSGEACGFLGSEDRH